jgi:hypothetical protein
MEDNIKKLSSYDQTVDNPFLDDDGNFKSFIQAYPKHKFDGSKDGSKVEINANEDVGYKDTASFIKYFGGTAKRAQLLSNAGSRVFGYIMEHLAQNIDWITINYEDCRAFCGYDSTQAVRKGILDLLEHRFIARKTGYTDRYHINPNYFFNGKREMLPALRDYRNIIAKPFIRKK